MAILSYPQRIRYLLAAGAPPSIAVTLAAVAQCESGGNTLDISAVNSNGYRDYGWLQIDGEHFGGLFAGYRIPGWPALADPATNARAAVAIWRVQGLTAWTTYWDGCYKDYRPAAQAALAQGSIAPRPRPKPRPPIALVRGFQHYRRTHPRATFAAYLAALQIQRATRGATPSGPRRSATPPTRGPRPRPMRRAITPAVSAPAGRSGPVVVAVAETNGIPWPVWATAAGLLAGGAALAVAGPRAPLRSGLA